MIMMMINDDNEMYFNLLTPLSFQSGNSSFNAVGSMQAPDSVCRPEHSARYSRHKTHYDSPACKCLLSLIKKHQMLSLTNKLTTYDCSLVALIRKGMTDFYWLVQPAELTRSSATAKSTARPSCLVGVLYDIYRETNNRSTANQPLVRKWP